MTIKVLPAVLLCAILAGCGGEEDAAAVRREEAAREEAAQRERTERRREIVVELRDGVADAARREELESEEKRLAKEIAISNHERLRRDREEVRRQILEKKKRGGT